MSKLDISNVIRVTLLQALRGLADINTSALAIITDDVPIPGNYGTARTYLNPTGVAEDFGSISDTYRLAIKVFQQNPNIITGGGYLVVIPRLAAALAQPATVLSPSPVNLLALTATNYNLRAIVDSAVAANILIGELDLTSLAAAEASLNSSAIIAADLEFVLSGELNAAFVTLRTTTIGATSNVTISEASTGTDIGAPLGLIDATATGAAAGLERVKDAIIRTNGAVEYFGIIANEKLADADLIEVANIVQTMDKLYFAPSNLTADIAGVFTDILDAGLTQTRCLLYTDSEAAALDFAAGYASRGLSINFDGAGTAHTMHLKEITGMVADDGLNQSLLDAAKAAGVDIYADFGVPKLFTSGTNQFFDQVYTRLAFKLRLRVAGFNLLARTNTKIAQTEAGMNSLKGAYRQICAQFVTAGVFGPGKWNDPTTFGDPADHVRNIADIGYYVYSIPISQQGQLAREARVAPVVQIAAKDSGAIHSSDVIAFIEA